MKKVTAFCILIFFASCSAGHYTEESDTVKNSNNIFAGTRAVHDKSDIEKRAGRSLTIQ